MRTRLLTKITPLLLLGGLIGLDPVLASAAERGHGGQRPENFRPPAPREASVRLEARSHVAPRRQTMSKHYIRQRLDWLRLKDPHHAKAFVYFDTLIGEGYDPLLLDAWLDGLYDGVVVVGMPDELVRDYYGQPVFQNDVIYEGAPAVEWGVRLLPGRVEKLTVVHGKVVRVHG